MELKDILSIIRNEYKDKLGSNLIGIYVHGSIAFDCFNWQQSDIDFLVVVRNCLTQLQKEAMIRTLLRLSPSAPPKGFEMSVVLYEDCQHFKFPTPFELHFSNMLIAKVKSNLSEYCRTMNGTDCDLSAHFTVVREVGVVVYGAPIHDVFEKVPKQYYLLSIQSDVKSAEKQIVSNPIYIILNLCRVLAYVKSSLILSKKQGGQWGITYLPDKFKPIVRNALACYCSDKEMVFDAMTGQEFCQYMNEAISTSTC